MKTNLKNKLIDHIRQNGKVHWKDLERLCSQNDYRWADNGTKRLRECRQKDHPNYEPCLDISLYPGTATIEYYTWQTNKFVSSIMNLADLKTEGAKRFLAQWAKREEVKEEKLKTLF